MNKKVRGKTCRVDGFVLLDWCGSFSESQFSELLALGGSKKDSKTTAALREFFVNGVPAFEVKEKCGIHYSVINRAVWQLVDRHIQTLSYGKRYSKVSSL